MLFFNPKVLIFFLFHHENICCGYSLEAPRQGASNEYPQHMFSWRNKKNIYLILTLIYTNGRLCSFNASVQSNLCLTGHYHNTSNLNILSANSLNTDQTAYAQADLGLGWSHVKLLSIACDPLYSMTYLKVMAEWQ